jgi:pyruvate,water dikinase
MKYLIRFDDEGALDPQVVGQKFHALARASRRGFAVPHAVAVSTDAHRFFLANHCWPEGLLGAVIDAATVLDLSRGLSIRSSAIHEDLEKQSFAGQYRSFLQVVNQEDLKKNIEECWRCVDYATVRSYLSARQLSDEAEQKPFMAVVIQKMVHARAAGIAFGRNPLKPAAKEIVIEAVKGLAEGLVSGHRTPYRAVVDAGNMVRVTPPTSKSRLADPTDYLLHSYSFWREIARLVKDLEHQNSNKPLDIEWAVDGQNKIWLLQSRTITTLDDTSDGVPPGLWTRKIANDLWADRLTPLLARHMVKNAPRFDLSRVLRLLGIPVIRPTLGVINGYLYLNGASIIKGVSCLPARLRLPELDSLLPASVGLNSLPGPSIPRLLAICIRSVWLPIAEPGVNPFICLRLAKHNLKTINRQIERVAAMPQDSSAAALEKVNAALETLAQLQIKNQWPYFFATFTTWLLRWLAINRMGLSHADFLNLLSENAGNVSIDIEREFRKMAQNISRDRELADNFVRASADHLAEEMPPAFRTDLESFLKRYGCRSRHRTLFIERWAEAPREVVGILQSLVRTQLVAIDGLPAEGSQEAELNTAVAGETAAETEPSRSAVDFKYPTAHDRPFSRLALSLTKRIARRFLDLREELRFTMDRVLYLLRCTLLDLGMQTGLGDKIMFLDDNELQDVVRGRLSQEQAAQRAALRCDEYMQPFDAPTFYHDGLVEDEFHTDGTLIRGIGTSPGRARGPARIVDNPAQADIQKGDILIAKNTDPGWTPILSIVGGMVMEEGGLLNHCAIIARELGVPAVVGVHAATRRIRNNDLVTIDGGQGVIVIED